MIERERNAAQACQLEIVEVQESQVFGILVFIEV
jgi:hypothetical protein